VCALRVSSLPLGRNRGYSKRENRPHDAGPLSVAEDAVESGRHALRIATIVRHRSLSDDAVGTTQPQIRIEMRVVRLGVEAIRLYRYPRPDPLVSYAESARALADLLVPGKITDDGQDLRASVSEVDWPPTSI
jgi:aryl-alcohol dehydrogenase-like predicted oxidoreductase